MCASLRFRVRKTPEKYFYYQRDVENYTNQVLDFFIIWWIWIYTHGIFRSVILVSIYMLGVNVTFSLFFKIWLTNQSLFSDNNFSEELASYWLLELYVTSFFRRKQTAFTGMALRKLVRRTYGRKSPVSNKYENLHSFQETVILLCQSILEARRISHLHSSALFTIALFIYFIFIF